MDYQNSTKIPSEVNQNYQHNSMIWATNAAICILRFSELCISYLRYFDSFLLSVRQLSKLGFTHSRLWTRSSFVDSSDTHPKLKLAQYIASNHKWLKLDPSRYVIFLQYAECQNRICKPCQGCKISHKFISKFKTKFAESWSNNQKSSNIGKQIISTYSLSVTLFQ